MSWPTNRLDGPGSRVRYDRSRPRQPVREAGPTRRVRLIETSGEFVRLAEYNHYHDAHGRFAPGGAGSLDTSGIAGEVGAGVDANGGASVALDGGVPTEGFMVAYAGRDGHHIVLPANVSKAERDATIRQWVKDQREFVKSNPEHYFGGWIDSKDGRTHLDVSERYAPSQRDLAIKRGTERNQISIFDLGTFEEIPTGGTGE